MLVWFLQLSISKELCSFRIWLNQDLFLMIPTFIFFVYTLAFDIRELRFNNESIYFKRWYNEKTYDIKNIDRIFFIKKGSPKTKGGTSVLLKIPNRKRRLYIGEILEPLWKDSELYEQLDKHGIPYIWKQSRII